MDKAQVELLRGYLEKAREKLRVARDLTLFGLLLVKTGKFDRKWGRVLATLKDDRETADYEAMSWIDEETARRAVEEAEGFVEAVGAYVGRLLPGGMPEE